MRLSVGSLEYGDTRLIRDEQNVSMATSELLIPKGPSNWWMMLNELKTNVVIGF